MLAVKMLTQLSVKGLKRLEYRGYDSAGIAIGSDSCITILKHKR